MARISGARRELPGLVIQAPNAKVTGGALAGSFVVLITWAVRAVTDVDVPAEVAASLTVLVTFFVSYFVVDAVPPPVSVSSGEPTIGSMTPAELRAWMIENAEVSPSG